MAIPTNRKIRLPLLRFVVARSKEGDVSLVDARQYLAEEFQLTEEEKEKRWGKSQALIFYTLVAFARQDLINVGFIEKKGTGFFISTEVGKRFENLSKAGDYSDLENLPGFREHKRQVQKERREAEEQKLDSLPNSTMAGEEDSAPADSPSDDRIQRAYDELTGLLQSDLKDQIFSEKMSPRKFELLVLRVLEKIGYGEGEHTGGPGDGGIDGIMNKDSLGFRRVFVQVKHNDSSNSVGSGDIDKFVGSLSKKSRDAQGVFVTSSSFSPAAKKALAEASAHHIVLIDGDRLTELMIKHEIGIREKDTYTIYDIDKNFWTFDDD